MASDAGAPLDATPEDRAPSRDWNVREWSVRHGARAVKTAVGVALVGFAAMHAYEAWFVNKSTSGSLVAGTFTLSAPISGIVRHDISGAGVDVPAGRPVITIENPRIDRSRLARLEAEVEALRGDISARVARRSELLDLGATYESRDRRYLGARRQQGEIEVEQARATVEAARARFESAQNELARRGALRSEGLANEQEYDTARHEATVTEQLLHVAEHDLARKVAALESTKAGFTFDTSTASDRSYSSQRADDVDLRVAEIDAELAERKSALGSLEREFAAEEKQLKLLSTAELTSPGRRRVWDVLVEPGEFAYAGRPLLSWIDCAKIHVVAYVNLDTFEKLRVGTEARVIGLGADDFEELGRVVALPGQREHLEIPKPPAGGTRPPGYAVLVGSERLSKSLERGCQIGQAVEVRFSP